MLMIAPITHGSNCRQISAETSQYLMLLPARASPAFFAIPYVGGPWSSGAQTRTSRLVRLCQVVMSRKQEGNREAKRA